MYNPNLKRFAGAEKSYVYKYLLNSFIQPLSHSARLDALRSPFKQTGEVLARGEVSVESCNSTEVTKQDVD